MFEQAASFDPNKNGMFSPQARQAKHEAQVAQNALAQAQQKIAQLEKALVNRDHRLNALSAVAVAVREALVQESPQHPLTNQANRDKIYDMNFKL